MFNLAPSIYHEKPNILIVYCKKNVRKTHYQKKSIKIGTARTGEEPQRVPEIASTINNTHMSHTLKSKFLDINILLGLIKNVSEVRLFICSSSIIISGSDFVQNTLKLWLKSLQEVNKIYIVI